MRPTLALLLTSAIAACVPASAEDSPRVFPPYARPTLIAHRGDSGRAPEHTIPAYRLALEAGADFVEPDLQITKDGVLVCLHDTTLERTTDVESVFPGRSRTIKGREAWPVADFTLEEIRRLDAGSWKGPQFKGLRVPTFQEMIDLVRGHAGIIPETKAPEAYEGLGLDMAGLLMDALRKNGLDVPGADPKTPVVVQSFSIGSIKALRERHGCKLPILALLDEPGQVTGEAIAGLKGLVDGIAPSKNLVLKRPGLVDDAHRLGLSVTVWTFRAGAAGSSQQVREEMARFLGDLKVDAVFTDNPDQFPRR
ncbi:Glycerophosphoryl diester phosphodiesterase precursor [Aquisphaera giovannonii]|uniref:Glycerophosphoryl diester phosphodiesterase n=1 Tax=Aquisphaera giovannonii TaxID=406548 RepID=A0A5B9W1K6_9BACT|nr:glycerophosphodiester phosphodiesterase family protein [Aquisphaera giovannonii]QEH34433.1 Glycerophosphoryl diester phosphodiesterase precursor [Aquisphaera giovannonii]